MATKATTPQNLGREGKALWSQITKAYDLRPDEVRILVDACREADLIERMQGEVADGALTARGSQGQPVPAPMVSEIRQHRNTLAALLKSLKLPDSDEQSKQRAEETSQKAREAARARWDRPRQSS
jgi:uncharacterized caspase-like protein